jgi:hypothetical protein
MKKVSPMSITTSADDTSGFQMKENTAGFRLYTEDEIRSLFMNFNFITEDLLLTRRSQILANYETLLSLKWRRNEKPSSYEPMDIIQDIVTYTEEEVTNAFDLDGYSPQTINTYLSSRRDKILESYNRGQLAARRAGVAPPLLTRPLPPVIPDNINSYSFASDHLRGKPARLTSVSPVLERIRTPPLFLTHHEIEPRTYTAPPNLTNEAPFPSPFE